MFSIWFLSEKQHNRAQSFTCIQFACIFSFFLTFFPSINFFSTCVRKVTFMTLSNSSMSPFCHELLRWLKSRLQYSKFYLRDVLLELEVVLLEPRVVLLGFGKIIRINTTPEWGVVLLGSRLYPKMNQNRFYTVEIKKRTPLKMHQIDCNRGVSLFWFRLYWAGCRKLGISPSF